MDLMTGGRTGRRRAKEISARLGSLDVILLLTSLVLCGIGIGAVYIAGQNDQRAYAVSQAQGLVIGLAGAVALMLIDYRFWQRFLRPIYAVMLAMLVVVLVVGVSAGGAQRWIDVGPVQVQPSEFAKPLMVVVLAGYLASSNAGRLPVLLKALALTAVPAFLVFLQPDLGTAGVFGAIFLVVAYAAGARLWQLGGLVLIGAVGGGIAVRFGLIPAYQIARITAFLNHDCTSGISYQVCQSRMAIGSGGFFGKGLGATTLANLGFLPEDHTDFIFSNLAERIGFVGSVLIIGLFFVLIWRSLRVATIARDRFGVLLAAGISTIFLFHVFVNIGMTMGIMPVAGIPLPFISYGRSSLVVDVMAVGLLESIAMRARQLPRREEGI